MLIRERVMTGMRAHLAYPHSVTTGWVVYTAKFFS